MKIFLGTEANLSRARTPFSYPNSSQAFVCIVYFLCCESWRFLFNIVVEECVPQIWYAKADIYFIIRMSSAEFFCQSRFWLSKKITSLEGGE